MSHVLRSTVQLAATFVAAAAVSRSADSVRHPIAQIADDRPVDRHAPPAVVVRPAEPGFVRKPVVEPVPSYHPFGPEPISFGPAPTAVARVVGFQPERALPKPRAEKLASEPAVSIPETLVAGVVGAVVSETPLDELVRPEPEPEPEAQPRLVTEAVHGFVSNVHGRGLRSVRVEVVSADKTVVGSTKTIDDGRFIVDGVPPGAYFLRAFDDVEGNFEKSWFGGRNFRTAESFTVTTGSPVDGIDVVLRSTAQIDVEAIAGERKTVVVVRVTHRATGVPATGEVELTTKNSDHISVTLVDGQAHMSFTDGDMTPVKKVRIYYNGDHQTRPASTKTKVL